MYPIHAGIVPHFSWSCWWHNKDQEVLLTAHQVFEKPPTVPKMLNAKKYQIFENTSFLAKQKGDESSPWNSKSKGVTEL